MAIYPYMAVSTFNINKQNVHCAIMSLANSVITDNSKIAAVLSEVRSRTQNKSSNPNEDDADTERNTPFTHTNTHTSHYVARATLELAKKPELALYL